MKEMFGKIEFIEKFKDDIRAAGPSSIKQGTPQRVENKEVLRKEFKEDSLAKANMLSFIVDNIVGQLSLPENYEVINKMAGEGEAEKLAEKLWKYSGKLGSKRIEFNNSAMDTMRNLGTSLLGYVDRIKRKGFNEDYGQMILSSFNAFKNYVELLMTNRDFERQELESAEGYLRTRIDKKELEFLRRDRKGYVEKCEEFLRQK